MTSQPIVRPVALGVPAPFHWICPDLQVTQGRLGRELTATRAIPTGTLVHMAGGHVMTVEQCLRLPEALQHFPTHISDDLLIGRMTLDEPEEPGEFVNHSCDPNCGMQDQLAIVTRRPIAPGEAITIDYAMCMTSSVLDMQCDCGAPMCRGRITGDDWRLPELQRRYRGYFVAYIRRKIDAE